MLEEESVSKFTVLLNPEEVTRECALYLKPEDPGESVKDWLNSQQENFY